MTEPITMPIAKIRSDFGEIIDKAKYSHQPYIVTKQNKPSAVILGVTDYYDMIDAMDTMAEQLDPEFQKSLIDSKKEIESGQGISFGDLKKSFSD